MSGKKVAALVVLGVIAISIVVMLALPGAGPSGPVSGDTVALIRLSGAIQESSAGSLLGGGGISPGLVRQRLEAAERDPWVVAVILRIDSPGGTVAASQEIAALVRDFPKPMVVSMGDMAASGGYYVAAQADRIVAQPGTLTGSIGVIWTTMDLEGLLEKLGIEQEVVTAGRHKDMFQRVPLSPEERRIVEEMVAQMYDQFVRSVSEGRGMPEARVRELATGRIYTGQQAAELGLVDVLGGLEEALREAEDLAGVEDAVLVELTPSFFEQLFYGPGFGELRLLVERLVLGDELTLLRELMDGWGAPRYASRP